MQTIRPPLPVGAESLSFAATSDPTDEIFDLTDRRRVLLRLLFAVDVAEPDGVFDGVLPG